MSHPQNIDVTKRIDDIKFGALQVRVIVLCVLVCVLEGFDTQTISFVAPALSSEWGVPRSSFGPAFSASLFGIMIGSIAFGFVGDLWGRKPVIILSFFMVGLFTLLTGLSDSISDLIVYRFLTGLGLGGTIPTAIALSAEYSPNRIRAMNVAIVTGGLPLGSALGGLVVGPMLTELGWRSVFYVGGLLPILLCLALLFLLPESIKFLTTRDNQQKRASALLAKLDRTYQPKPEDVLIGAEKKTGRTPLASLFLEKRLPGTLLLWALFALNLLMLYLLLNWLPTILIEDGLPLEAAIRAITFFMIGGIVCGIVLGRVVDKTSPYLVLAGVYVLAGIATAALAALDKNELTVYALSTLAGAAIFGPQPAINALATSFYPIRIRSIGVGAALAVGRIGAIAGPLLGGAVLASSSSPSTVFYFLIIPALICSGLVFLFGRFNQTKAPEPLPIREFDHLMCGVQDAERAVITYEKLGFTVGPITPLEGIGVSNCRILFTPTQENCANYIEFMQLSGASGEPPSFLKKWLGSSFQGNEGADCMIMRSDDAKFTYDHFESLHEANPDGGFEPYLLEHEFNQTGPNGEPYRVAFSNCVIPDLEPPLYISTSQIRSLDFYLISEWLEHANGAQSWTATVAVSNTPVETAALMQEAWGGTVSILSEDHVVCGPGNLPLIILTEEQFSKTYGKAAQQSSRERPYIAGVHLSSTDLDATLSYFQANNIPCAQINNRIILPAELCHGVMICFERSDSR